jgi:hypothetical protein
MGSGARVVGAVRGNDPVKPCCIEHDHVIEALASNRADHALNVSVLPRRARGSANRVGVHPRDGGRHVRKDRIVIVL